MNGYEIAMCIIDWIGLAILVVITIWGIDKIRKG